MVIFCFFVDTDDIKKLMTGCTKSTASLKYDAY